MVSCARLLAKSLAPSPVMLTLKIAASITFVWKVQLGSTDAPSAQSSKSAILTVAATAKTLKMFLAGT